MKRYPSYDDGKGVFVWNSTPHTTGLFDDFEVLYVFQIQINHGTYTYMGCLANHSLTRLGSGLEKMNLQAIFAQMTNGC
tara:strand:+ start:265 stop:501 length:237 start_codon:yes stop_codon:yes gene_type:complete